MYLFVLYAFLVWTAVYYFRKRWPAYLVLFISIPIVILGARLVQYTLGMNNGLLRFFAWAYEALILLVGITIVLTPTRAAGKAPCHGCQYDLSGNRSGRCPECGVEHGLIVPVVAPVKAPPVKVGLTRQPALRSPDPS